MGKTKIEKFPAFRLSHFPSIHGELFAMKALAEENIRKKYHVEINKMLIGKNMTEIWYRGTIINS